MKKKNNKLRIERRKYTKSLELEKNYYWIIFNIVMVILFILAVIYKAKEKILKNENINNFYEMLSNELFWNKEYNNFTIYGLIFIILIVITIYIIFYILIVKYDISIYPIF